MFKSTNAVCSHCLLVATLNGELDIFIRTYSRIKNPMNYTHLAQHGLPVGGKKPSSKRKASSKKTTSKIHKILADTDVWTKRGQLSRSTTPSYPTGSMQEVMYLTCVWHYHLHKIVGINAPYTNFGSASVSSPTLALQQPPPLINTLSLQPPRQPLNVSSMHTSQFLINTPSQLPMSTQSMQSNTQSMQSMSTPSMQPQFPMNTQSVQLNTQSMQSMTTPSMQPQFPQSMQSNTQSMQFDTSSMQPAPPPL